MAVTSIWSIKGWIGKVIKYAENPDKTKENNEGQISENQSQSTQGLEDVITYAVNTEKTRRGQSESMERELVGESEELMEQYVSGVNCAPTTAREEMIAVKMILSILVDTFISKISLTMQPGPKIDSISGA